MSDPPPPRPPRSFSTAAPPPRRLLVGCDRLAHLVGAHLLVGVTIRAQDGTLVERRQFHGTVIEVTDGVVVVRHEDGETLLPAEPDAYEPARPGTYQLACGEDVVDPDYLSTWEILPED